jgi:hypothetical protein
MRHAIDLGLTKTWLGAIAGLLCAFACTGCLGFEREIMVLVQPAKNADACMLLVYDGIHAASDGNANESIIKACFQDKQGFYFGHPLLGYFLSGPLAEREAGMSDREKQIHRLVRSHVSIADAGLFLNEGGKLCGWQILTLRKTDQLVRGFNELITSYFADLVFQGLADPKKSGSEWDRHSLQIIRRSIQQRHAWLCLEPGRISFALPGNQSFFRELKRSFLSDWEATGAIEDQIEAAKRRFAILSETALSVDQRRDLLTISLGVGDEEPIRVTCDYGSCDPQKLDDQLIRYARYLGGNLEKRRIEPFIADFLRHHRTGPLD